MKKAIIISVFAIILLLGGVWVSNNTQGENGEIISRSGVHWHPTLEIYIRGEKQNIPANIGIIGQPAGMHTHDSTGVLHIEESGVIYENDLRLGEFFRIWGKEFNSTQIFDNHNDSGGTVQMFVNGEKNTDFENYLMRDSDKIEIRYE